MRCSGLLRSVDWLFTTDVSGQHIVPIFKGQAEKTAKTVRHLQIGPISCPETSVREYHSTLRKSPGECRSRLNRDGSVTSHIAVELFGFQGGLFHGVC